MAIQWFTSDLYFELSTSLALLIRISFCPFLPRAFYCYLYWGFTPHHCSPFFTSLNLGYTPASSLFHYPCMVRIISLMPYSISIRCLEHSHWCIKRVCGLSPLLHRNCRHLCGFQHYLAVWLCALTLHMGKKKESVLYISLLGLNAWKPPIDLYDVTTVNMRSTYLILCT